MTFRAKIDHECYGEKWWDTAQNSQVPTDIAELIFGVDDFLEVTISEETATWVRSLPGWDAGPEYARHPLILTVAGETQIIVRANGETVVVEGWEAP